MAFQLRPYQVDCLNKVKSEKENGVYRQVIQQAAGAGKTECFVRLHKWLGLKKKTLVLVHRDFLCRQAVEKYLKCDPNIGISVEMAGFYADPKSDVVVASVATLGRKNSTRLLNFNPEEFDLIICDEAHHAAASSWITVLGYFDVLPNQGNKHKILSLGFTATPYRFDQKGLFNIFEKITFEKDILELIEEGFLARPRVYKVETDINIGACPTNCHDFISYELDKFINVDKRNFLILDSYKKYLYNTPTIGFCNSIAHSMELVRIFKESNIAAECMSYMTIQEERDELFNKFKSGEVKVLFNTAVLTEGLDVPQTGGILYCKSTKSKGLYIQSVSRALRVHPDKSHAIILDFMDNAENHSLASFPDLMGLPFDFDLEGTDALKTLKRLKELKEANPNLDVNKVKNLTQAEYKATEVYNLFDARKDSNQGDYSTLTWVKMWDGSWRLSLVTPDRDWKIFGIGQKGGKFVFLKMKEVVWEGKTLRETFRYADQAITKHFPNEVKLIKAKGSWRSLYPTENQINFLKRKGGFEDKVVRNINRGQASVLTTKIILNEEMKKGKIIEPLNA